MRTGKIFAILVMAAASSLQAQPVINADGVVSNASYLPSGFPNSGIAPGSIFAVFGKGMGPSTLARANSFPLLTALAGTSIKVTVAGTTVNAIMLYTVDGQVGAILPSSTPVGDGTLTVTYNGQTSAAVPIHVVKSAPGIFAVNQAGSGPGIITDLNFSTNLITASAAPGQVMILWATGLGPVSGDEAAGPLPGVMPSGVTVEVFVGGKPAKVVIFGRSGCCSGLDQVAFEVPQGITGCYVPVLLRVNGVVSNSVTISISSTGKLCSDSNGFTADDLQKIANGAGSISAGSVLLTRSSISITAPPPVGNLVSTIDTGSGAFVRYDFSKLIASTGASGYAPYGSCYIYQYRGNSTNIPNPVTFTYLDAGDSLTVTGPNGSKQIPKTSTGGIVAYSAQLGGGTVGLPGFTPLYLTKGTYTIDNGAGGKDVGPFRATLTLPDPLTWTNKDSVTNVPRSQDLLVTWSPTSLNGFVIITGGSANTNPQVSGAFICTERASAGQFSVPSVVLSALPASSTLSGVPAGFLSIGYSSDYQSGRFQATGIDVGYAIYFDSDGKNINFQ